jgi:alpha-glucosidase
MNYVGEKPSDPLSFDVYADDKGQAATMLYEDDGTSPAYKQGVFRRTRVSVAALNRGWQINVAAPEGNYQPGARSFVFNLKTAAAAAPRSVTLDGRPLAILSSNAKGDGWQRDAAGLRIRVTDDGKAHQIEVK